MYTDFKCRVVLNFLMFYKMYILYRKRSENRDYYNTVENDHLEGMPPSAVDTLITCK